MSPGVVEVHAIVSSLPSGGKSLAIRRLDSGAEVGVDLRAGTRVTGFPGCRRRVTTIGVQPPWQIAR
jgi:hypothetical protein